MRSLSILLVLGALAAGLVGYLLLVDRGASEHGRAASAEPAVSTVAHVQGATSATEASEPARASRTGEASTLGSATGAGAHEVALERTVTGRVIDTRGRPVANADVYIASGDRSGGIPLENLDPERLSWAHRTAGKTDELGRLRIATVASDNLRVGVRAHGFAPSDRDVSSDASVSDLGDIVLADSVALNGHVLDAQHRPVSGAAMRRLDVHAKPAVILGRSLGDVVATTDDAGAFHVDELASGPWRLLIKAEGHPDKLEHGETAAPGQIVSGLEFVLEDGAEIQGSVVQVPDDALKQLWISAVPKNTGGDDRLYAGEHVDEARFVIVARGAHCAPDGTFSVRGLTRNVIYRLAARADEHDFFGHERSSSVEARAGESGVELVYKPATALVFQVVDDATSRPVTELEVRAGDPFMQPLMGDDGTIRHEFVEGRVHFERSFEQVGGGALEVVIEARGYKTKRVADLHPVKGRDLDLGIVRLEKSPVLVLHVVDDATGNPVSGAHVMLVNEMSAESTERAGTELRERTSPASAGEFLKSADTDREGRARLNSSLGERAKLSVRHPDFAPFQSDTTIPASLDDREETVRLRGGGRVTVEVRDALGAAVRGVPIRHQSPGAPIRDDDVRPIEELRSDASGRLQFTHLEAGLHRFEIDDAQHSHAATSRDVGTEQRDRRADLGTNTDASRQIEVSDLSEQTVVLVVPLRGRLTGRVTENGRPLSGATLRLAKSDPGEPWSVGAGLDARTNGNGDYALDDVDLGTYRMSVVHPMRSMEFDCELQISGGRNKHDVDLPLTTIEGRLVDEDDRPLAGLRVSVERAPAEGRRADSEVDPEVERVGNARVSSGADGVFVLRGVQSDVDLVVSSQGGDYQPARSDVLRLAPGQIKSGLVLKLVLGAALEIKVTNADGRPLSACRISAFRAEAQDEKAGPLGALTDASGAVHFSGLPSGTWHVRLEAGTDGTARDAASVPEQIVALDRGATKTVRFALR